MSPPMPAPAPRRQWRLDAALLGLGAAAVRLPAYLAAAHLSFDDAVYGASAIAMRNGGLPFRDVFSSQGPLHLPIVFVFDLAGGRTSSSPRLAAALAGVVAAVAAYAAGRRLASRRGALVAGALVGASGSVLWTTGPITADGPAIALVLVALALALRYRDAPGVPVALLTGGVFGAALSVKVALVAAAVLPVGGLVLAVRRSRDVAAAAVAAAAVGLAATLPWGFGRVWDQSVSYQLDSDRNASLRDNAEKILSTLWERDPLLLALGALAVAAAFAPRLRPTGGWGRRVDPPGALDRRFDPLLLAVWLGALLAFLVVEPAMWRNHIAHLVAPVALLIACRPPPLGLAATAAVVALPLQLLHLHPVLNPDPYRGDAAAVVEAVRALPPGAWAISDDPGFVWRAGRATPYDLVDTSVKRVQQGRITLDSLVSQASDRRVCAVVVWSSRQFGAIAGLGDALLGVGYTPARRFAGERVLYLRDDCDPR